MLNLIILKKKIPAQAQLPRTTLIQHYVSYLTPLSVVQPTNIKWLSLKLGDTRYLKKHFKPPQCKLFLKKHFNVIKTIVSFHSIVNGHKVSPLVVTKKKRPDVGIANQKVCYLKAHGQKASPITV
jgi:hypothetical protein